MDRVVALVKGKHGAEHGLAHAQALALARSGRLHAARQSSNGAVDLALQEGAREEAASYRAARAVWEAICGNADEAKRDAVAARGVSQGRDVVYAAGLALALSRDSSRSEALAGDLEKRFPEDTFVRFTYVPILRALTALRRGKPADSVERLQDALRYELAANGLNFNHYRFVLGLCARRGFASHAPVYGSGRRVSEDSQPSRSCGDGSHRRAGAPATWQSVRVIGR